MESTVICVTKRIARNFFRKMFPVAVFVALLIATLLASAAYADMAQEVRQIFELHQRFTPGMPIEAFIDALGPAEASHAVSGPAAITRYVWLYGIKGIVVYEVEGRAHRIEVTLPCGTNQNMLVALDALTRQGRDIHRHWPMGDTRRGEHYWIRDGVRFSFGRYNETTVRTSSTRAH